MCSVNTLEMDSPVGLLHIAEHDGFITELRFLWEGAPKPLSFDCSDDFMYFGDGSKNALQETVSELNAYFSGELQEFTLPFKIAGTPFQQKVWKTLLTIPYGETIPYKELAVRIGNPKAIRAVGGANNKNPISIILPCHRVIGSDGKLVGYGGGMDAKKLLLELEASEA